MAEHEDRAREMERELDEMEERADRLEQEIEATQEDWERKQRDPSVPGATGDPESAEGDVAPEADYPSKGD
jgi:predicted  nucleic acid-binding Zn-ribbon protein